MQFTRRVRMLFGGLSGLVLAFLYLPLLIIVVSLCPISTETVTASSTITII